MHAEAVLARCASKPPAYVRLDEHLAEVADDLAHLTTWTLSFAYWMVIINVTKCLQTFKMNHCY